MTDPHDRASESPTGGIDTALALVCTLSPLDRDGRRVSVEYLFERAIEWAVLEDGVHLEFPGAEALVRTLLDFVLAERECCPHFTYELGFVPDHTRVTLRLRAGDGYVAPLKAMYGGLARRAGIGARA